MPGRGNPEYQGPEMRRCLLREVFQTCVGVCTAPSGSPCSIQSSSHVSHRLGPDAASGSSWLTLSEPVRPAHSPGGGTASPQPCSTLSSAPPLTEAQTPGSLPADSYSLATQMTQHSHGNAWGPERDQRPTATQCFLFQDHVPGVELRSGREAPWQRRLS